MDGEGGRVEAVKEKEKKEASIYSKAQVMAEEEKIRSCGGSDGRQLRSLGDVFMCPVLTLHLDSFTRNLGFFYFLPDISFMIQTDFLPQSLINFFFLLTSRYDSLKEFMASELDFFSS